ncbi:MAG: hypothetical protein K1060chlam4_00064 [Candidatus Anoxychlamydiales bacterium]|nr:hypothetical protein [Candidatus Anoxychlamydiales bacterium]
MTYKPLEERTYRKYLKIVGWKIIKGSIDHKLYDKEGKYVCTIKISHGKSKKKEVAAFYINKTKNILKKDG